MKISKKKKIKKNISKSKEGHKQQNQIINKYIEKTKLLTDKNLEERNKSTMHRHMSKDLINNKKIRCFKNLFKLLDSEDKDGKISDKNINTKNLSKEIKLLLEPIFTELKNCNETLSESEFVFICDKLFESLKYVQKQKLLSFNLEENKNQLKDNEIKVPEITKEMVIASIVKHQKEKIQQSRIKLEKERKEKEKKLKEEKKKTEKERKFPNSK